MNKLFKIYISVIFLIILTFPVKGKSVTGSESMDSIPEKPFNALEYSLQKRYKNPGEVFVNTRFTDNMYVTLHTGIESLLKRGNSGFGTGPTFGFTIGKHFNPLNSLRATAMIGWYTREAKDFDLVNSGVHFTHLFNLSSYIYGYNPNRVFELSTFKGLGYQRSKLDNVTRGVGNLHLGLQLKVHPTPRMDIMIEPRLSFYTDGIDHSSQKNWHGFDMGYGGTIGINYRFTPSGSNYESNYLFRENSLFDNTFLNISGGTQFPMSNDILNEIGLGNAMGTAFTISGGKWIIPMLGFQLSLFSSFNKWGKDNDDRRYISLYYGSRIEGLVNILSFFKTDLQDSRFGLTGSIGMEWARMKKETEEQVKTIQTGYTGLTGAIQFKYYTSKQVGFFIESRFSQAPYSVFYNRVGVDELIRESHIDNLCSFNIGVELRCASKEQRITSKANQANFTPFFFAGVNGGWNLLLSEEQFHQNSGYQFGARIGRKITPLSSVRTGIDFTSYKYTERDISMKLFLFPVDYLFDLTNYISGYNQSRKLSLDFLAGMIFATQSDPSGFQFGGETGFVLSYKVSRKIDIQLEPVVRLYSSKFIPEAKVKGVNLLLSTTLGVYYCF